MRIPVAAPDLSGNEERYLLEALRSSWISSTGPFVDRFEREFAALCGTRAAIGVCNGTMALHLALMTMDLRPGDEVLVPALTYVATANAVRYCGGEPVFVDVDPNTWCLDPAAMERSITRRTKGVIPVHLYGHPADMDPINHLAATHGLWVVEDAAEAHFARYKGRTVGSLSRIGVFSFYANKLVSCGEGGAATLEDPALERRARLLRGQGVDPERRYFFPITGYNYRLTNLSCALLCAQLERAKELTARRKAIFARYREGLKDVPGLGMQPVASWAETSPWLFCVTVDPAAYGRTRDEVMALLADAGIETRPFFVPLNRLPPFKAESKSRGDYLPHTNRLGDGGLNLPTFSGLADRDLDEITERLRLGRR
jgi:perosamine synthetase